MTPEQKKARARFVGHEHEKAFRAAHGNTTEPFTIAFGARMIAWLATPEGKAAFVQAVRDWEATGL